MSTQFHLEGEQQFDRALDEWIARAERASAAALTAAGHEVAIETAASFNGSGPVSRTGRLAHSVVTTAPVKKSSGWEAQVGPAGLIYVRRVELGKRGRRSAGPHPFFQPGYQRAGGRFAHIFAHHWAQAQPKGA